MEDEWALEPADLPAALDDDGKLPDYRQDAAVLVLRVLGPQPNRLLVAIVVLPLECPHLTDAPGREEEKQCNVGDVGWQMLA